MNEPRGRDHRGIWKIEPPKDMPLVQIAMLQETIKEAWTTYGGDPNNGEQFWNHLVGNGMANVPRETSPDGGVCHGETMIEHFENCVPGGKAALDKARSELVGAELVAKRQRNVPRETSEGEA
jgi:hypothetical protein